MCKMDSVYVSSRFPVIVAEYLRTPFQPDTKPRKIQQRKRQALPIVYNTGQFKDNFHLSSPLELPCGDIHSLKAKKH